MRERIWKIGKRVFDVSCHGLIMGVLNVTPDSFSDGGEFLTADKATERGLQMAAEGAHIIDIGGESTHPGSEPVPVEEELRRVIPVIENLRRKLDVPISIDTSKTEVARAAIEAGASIVNDVTGGQGDEQMQPRYTDVVAEISEFFRQQYALAIGLNIAPMAIAFDPGIGFGKTLEHNLELLAQLERLRVHDRALVVGVSRKSFLGKLIGSPEISDRLIPGLALTSLLRARGADVLRVHNVRENVYALGVTEAILQRAK